MSPEQWTWEESVAWLRQQPDQQALVRACYYDDPLLVAAQRFARSEEWRALRAFLPHPAGRALDIGAGRGISSYALALAGWQVVALEPDPSNLVGARAILSLARESSLPILVEEAIAEAAPFDDCTFDLVYGREVLHHSLDLSRLCQEAARVLKPGGQFVVTRETVISNPEDLTIFLDKHPLHKYFGGENALLLDRYLSAMRDSGLDILRVLGPLDNPINFHPYDDASHFSNTRKRLLHSLHRFLVRSLYGVRSKLVHMLPERLAYALFHALDAPGRLYSFIANKPVD